jgi:hypothetical protein
VEFLDPPALSQAVGQSMKSVRTALSAEGRLDILKRVLPYRGGLGACYISQVRLLTEAIGRLFTAGSPFRCEMSS